MSTASKPAPPGPEDLAIAALLTSVLRKLAEYGSRDSFRKPVWRQTIVQGWDDKYERRFRNSLYGTYYKNAKFVEQLEPWSIKVWAHLLDLRANYTKHLVRVVPPGDAGDKSGLSSRNGGDLKERKIEYDKPEDFNRLRYARVEVASSTLKEFGFGGNASKLVEDDQSTWGNVLAAADAELDLALAHRNIASSGQPEADTADSKDCAVLRPDEVERPSSAEEPPRNAMSSRIFYVPVRTPEHFVGRDAALKEIEVSLKRAEGRVVITTLHGMFGVGKTALAGAYAERHREDYSVIWWINAQTSEGMLSGLVALGHRVGWVRKLDVALSDILERLVSDGDGVLLIYDNAIDGETTEPYFPVGGNAKIIVTSNSHAWGRIADPLQIDLWPKAIGAAFLLKRTRRPESERCAAEALSERLGGLPLALEQASAYCEDFDIDFLDYIWRLNEPGIDLLDDMAHAPPPYTISDNQRSPHGLTVAATVRLAIRAVTERCQSAVELLSYLAHLSSAGVPRFFFLEGRSAFPESFELALAGDGLDRMVAMLRRFSLVEAVRISSKSNVEVATACLSLHPLVQELVARDFNITPDVQSSLISAAALACPYDISEANPEGRERFDLLSSSIFRLVIVPEIPSRVEAQAIFLIERLSEHCRIRVATIKREAAGGRAPAFGIQKVHLH